MQLMYPTGLTKLVRKQTGTSASIPRFQWHFHLPDLNRAEQYSI